MSSKIPEFFDKFMSSKMYNCLQPGYNQKARYLPIRQKFSLHKLHKLHKLLNHKKLQKT